MSFDVRGGLLYHIRGEKEEERGGEQMRSVIADTLLLALWHLNCYIVTPPLHGGHMNVDIEVGYSASRWIIGTLCECLSVYYTGYSVVGTCRDTRGPRRIYEVCAEN